MIRFQGEGVRALIRFPEGDTLEVTPESPPTDRTTVPWRFIAKGRRWVIESCSRWPYCPYFDDGYTGPVVFFEVIDEPGTN